MNRFASALAAPLVLAAGAARATLPTVAASAPTAPAAGGLWQGAFGLLIVLGLIFALAWVARRAGWQRRAAGGVVTVVSSTAVGTRERVVVVEVAGQWLVLGVTPQQVTTLHTLPAQPGAAPAAGDAAAAVLGQFAGRLRDALGARTPAP